MVLITIVNGAYKPTYNWGAPHCTTTGLGVAHRFFFVGRIQCAYQKPRYEPWCWYIYHHLPEQNHPVNNGHSRILNWRYLPYIRPIFQAYVREYPHKIWPYMVQYLHVRILKFPLKLCRCA